MRTSVMNQRLGMSVAAILCAGLIATPATAQTMKAGLWEITNKMGGSGEQGAKMAAAQAQMQKEMAAMSPEQRKQMEKMMGQQGVGMSPCAGGGMATRICITKEMAARNETPAQTQGDCKQEQMTMDAQGKFVSSDCGSVKPIANK